MLSLKLILFPPALLVVNFSICPKPETVTSSPVGAKVTEAYVEEEFPEAKFPLIVRVPVCVTFHL